MNMAIITGNIGAVQVNPDNTKLRVATHFRLKDGSIGTDWHNAVAYGQKANLLANAKVGNSINIIGRMRTSVTETEKGKSEVTSIIISSFTLDASKESSNHSSE